MVNTELISLQLWSVRDFFAEDYKGTVKKVAEMGYKGVEFASGYGNLTADEMKAFLKKCGLAPIGSHVPFNQLKDNMQEVISYNKAIGNDYIVCPGAPLKTLEDFKAMCDTFNSFGKQCKDNGLLYGYHNHWHEFQTFGDGSVGYDILLNGTDPELVFFELDTCWVSVGGFDPVDYCKKYPGRFKLAHIKDYLNERDDKGRILQTDVGKGEMDFNKVIPALEDNGTEYLIIEQEGGVGKSIDYVKNSLNNLKEILKGLKY